MKDTDGKILRQINMEEPDGTMHRVLLYEVDITNDGRIVASYAYFVDGNRRYAYAELVNVNGVFCRNANPKEIDSNKFLPFDKEFSDSIIRCLEREVKLYKGSDKKIVTTGKKKSPIKKKETNKLYEITAVMVANRGEDITIIDKDYKWPLLFFSKIDTYNDSIKKYIRMNISPEDYDELMRKIEYKLPGKVNISSLPRGDEIDPIIVSSGHKYKIEYSSIAINEDQNDEELFYDLAQCDEIRVDSSFKKLYDLYPDVLSSALHHELPMELVTDGDVIKYVENSKRSNKNVSRR